MRGRLGSGLRNGRKAGLAALLTALLTAGLTAGALTGAGALLGAGTPGAAAQDEARSLPPQAATAPLAPLDGEETPAIAGTVLEQQLAPLVGDPSLGPAPGAVVLDAVTGQQVFAQRADTAVAPASSWKIATALAALAPLGPQHRLATTVVRDGDAGIVLVGGGDPTLLTLPPATPSGYGPQATLADLAEQTAATLAAAGSTTVAVRYDSSLFTGPALSPDWDPTFVGLGIVSPVSALTLDPSSQGVTAKTVDADPAAAAAGWFVARLTTLGIAATLAGPGTADAAEPQLAAVQSAPVVALVDRMLDVSDNDVAEALFRLAALGRGLPGSFDGGRQAVTDTFAELGVPVPGLVVRDGSGLSRENRVAPITLATSLHIAADPQSDALEATPATGDLGAMTWAPPGLPVGGLTGSLANRFQSAATSAGAGRVHAKTGTLTGVTSLTGLVTTRQGRPAVFAVLGSDTADTTQARRTLDLIAAQIAACGCEGDPS